MTSPRSDELAAVIVMFPLPSKATPLIFRAVCSLVAVPALPEIEPVTVVLKVLVPEKVLLSARSVEEAAVTVTDPPAFKVDPLMVPRIPERIFVPIEEVAMT